MKFSHIILTIVLAAMVSLGVNHFQKPVSGTAATKESVYDRVMRTGTLNCGYFVWPPLHIKDANTGAFSGISYDMIMELAKSTGLQVNWAGELNFGTFVQDIHDARYDAECGQGWPNGLRGKLVYYSKPYAFIPLVPVVRANDLRFDGDSASLNSPAVKIATIDGETSAMVARSRLPQAMQVTLPQNAGATDIFMNVTSGKADATLTDALTAYGYIQANPGKLKIVHYEQPLHLVALNSTLPQDERLKNMFDVATDELLQNGTIEGILKKYEPVPGIIWRVNEVFEEPEGH